MALIPLEIEKVWTQGSTIEEIDWDNIRTPLLQWSVNTNENLTQLAKDVFGVTYQYDNDGIPNRTSSLVDSVLFVDGDYTVTGTWSFTTITDLGTVGTADINGGTADGMTIGATTPAAGTFTSATISTTTRYYSVCHSDFIMCNGTDEQYRDSSNYAVLNTNVAFASKQLMAPVNLPHGAIVTSVKAYFYRDDAASTLTCSMERYGPYSTNVQMALCTSASVGGNHTVEDTTITSGTIDNSAYQYLLVLTIDNNNATTDAYCYSVLITYTITSPLP